MSEYSELKVPDIKTEELLSVVTKIKLVSGFQFSYNGVGYFLVTFTKQDMKKSEAQHTAFYAGSTLIDGYDIYILKALPKAERDRQLFHEILEANLRSQGFEQEEAHAITLGEEEKVYGGRGEGYAK